MGMTLDELRKRFTGNGMIQPGAGAAKVDSLLHTYDNATAPKNKVDGTEIKKQIAEQRAKVEWIRKHGYGGDNPNPRWRKP